MSQHRNRSDRNGDDPQGLLYLSGRYLEHLRVHNFSKHTVYQRMKLLLYFRRFCEELGITQARQVTRAVLMNYQSHLYHYRKPDEKPLAVGTQKNWLQAVTMFFHWLAKENFMLYNPAGEIEMPRGEFRLPKTVLSAAEVEAVLRVPDLATPLGLRDRAILEVFYSTGIRRLELCNLNQGDVDAARGLVRIEQGKGHKDRLVPIGQRALTWLERYLVEARPKLCAMLSEQALFVGAYGERMTIGRLSSRVHDILKESGIGKLGSCHVFRHTFATVLIENGCDVRHVQAMLGHAKLETTALYTHLSLKAVKQAHARYHPAAAVADVPA
jgi:integrase/recombinase XerD